MGRGAGISVDARIFSREMRHSVGLEWRLLVTPRSPGPGCQRGKPSPAARLPSSKSGGRVSGSPAVWRLVWLAGMSGQRLRGPAAVAAPLTGPRPDACAVAVTGVVEASPARKEFKRTVSLKGWLPRLDWKDKLAPGGVRHVPCRLGSQPVLADAGGHRHELRLSAEVEAALSGVYRRRRYPGCSSAARYRAGSGGGAVVIPFVASSPLATLLLMSGRHSRALLAAGCGLSGVCSGVVFGSATAWVQELSPRSRGQCPPCGDRAVGWIRVRAGGGVGARARGGTLGVAPRDGLPAAPVRQRQ